MSQRNKRIYCTHKIDRYTKKKQQKELWGITNMIVFKKISKGIPWWSRD